jgi:hypothetical protein
MTTSVGVGPFRLTSGSNGVGLTANIPGTGVSYHQKLSPNGSSSPSPDGPGPRREFQPGVPQYLLPDVGRAVTSGMTEIRSAESEFLTSPGLTAFKDLLSKAQSQHESIKTDLDSAKQKEHQDVGSFQSWERGWLFKHIFKKKFETLRVAAENAKDQREELDEQLNLSKLDTQFDMPDAAAKSFQSMCEAFGQCCQSERIWDNVAHRAANQLAERTIANRIVDLKPVKFALSKCSVIETQMQVPYLQNANGGDLYLYPGFVVYLASATNYALIEYKDLSVKVTRTRFHEESTIPSDAAQVGTTWTKCNKDGTPDRRFNANRQIPIMQYAILSLTSASGLNEEYLLSNVQSAEAFQAAWQFARSYSMPSN